MAKAREYTETEKLLLAKLKAKLGLKLSNQKTINNYAAKYVYMANKIVRKLYGDDAQVKPSFKYLQKERYYKLIPEILRTDTTIQGVHSRSGYISIMFSIAKNFGYTAAYDWLFKESKPFQKAKNELMHDEEQMSPSLEANWVDFKSLVTRMKTELMPAFNQLYAKLKESDGKVANQSQRRILNRAALAVMNLVEPNIRSVLSCVRVVTDEPTADEIGHGKPNLLYIPPVGECVVYVNTDKVSDRVGADQWKMHHQSSEFVRKSLDIYPRLYLFSKNIYGNECMTPGQYLKQLGETFTFGSKVAGELVIRHATATQLWIDYPSPSMKLRKDLARKMRHTAAVSDQVYRKVLNKDQQVKVQMALLEEEGKLPEADSITDTPPEPMQKKAKTHKRSHSIADSVESVNQKEEETCIKLPSDTKAAQRQRKYYNKNKAAESKRASDWFAKNKERAYRMQLVAKFNRKAAVPRPDTMDKHRIVCRGGTYMLAENA